MTETNALVQFLYGSDSNIPENLTEGAFYVTYDGYMYVDLFIGDGLKRIRLNNKNTTEILHDSSILSTIIDQYIMKINYNEIAFDTTALVVGGTSPIVGVGMADFMTLRD